MYKTLFEKSIQPLCVANTDGFLEVVNPAFTTVLGWTSDELTSKPFFDFIHPDDIDKTLKAVEDLKDGNNAINFENRYRHKDGDYRVINWNTVVDPESGKTYSVANDLTELRYAERRLQDISSALDDHAIIAQTDAKGVITDVNDHFINISGYSRDELIGKTHKV